MKYCKTLLALAIAFNPFLMSVQADTLYSATEITAPIGGNFGSVESLNDNGQIVGKYYTSNSSTSARLFIYNNGQATDLGKLNGTDITASKINNSGQITGSYTLANNASHAFLYSNGTFSDLGTLGGFNSYGYGINNKGDVTGAANVGVTQDGFLFSNGGLQDLGALGGTAPHLSSVATGINDAGQIIGYNYGANSIDTQAFIYSNHVLTLLGSLGNNRGSIANDINNNGDVTGVAYLPNGEMHAFLYRNGQMHDLGAYPGFNSFAYSINQYDQVVGASGGKAVMYNQGQIYDLNTLTATNGWEYISALAINNHGQILVKAQNLKNIFQTADFLLTPVPLPASAGLFASMLLGMGIIRRGHQLR